MDKAGRDSWKAKENGMAKNEDYNANTFDSIMNDLRSKPAPPAQP